MADQEDYLELILEAVESLISNITSIEDIKQVLDDQEAPSDNYTKLATHAKIGYILNGYLNLKGLVSIDIFTLEGAHYHVGDTLNVENSNQAQVSQLFAEALRSDKRLVWTGVEDNINTNSAHKKVIAVATVIKTVNAQLLKEKPLALLLVNYSVDSLYDHFSQLNLGEGAYMIILDARNRLVFHPNKRYIGSQVSPALVRNIAADKGTFLTHIDGQEMFATYNKSETSNWVLISFVPLKNLTAGADVIKHTLGLVLLICLSFILLAAITVSKNMIAPLNHITDLFKQIKAGVFDWNVRLDSKRTDEIGELIQWFNTFLDILEGRRWAEEALIQAKEAAESANKAKSEFLANMSHELRTPLNGILGYTQILKRDPSLTGPQQESIDIIQQSGEHLLILIEDILDLSKIEAGRMELHPAAFHLSGFLKNIVDIFQLRAKQKGIWFNQEYAADLPVSVWGDEKRLRQVLINLLSNAMKFTETGGVTLSVACLPTSELSEAGAGASSHIIQFKVEDTGIGIKPEHQAEIFWPFHQVGFQRGKVEGTGLGLAISQRLVEMMDGGLSVNSTPGKGSIFYLEVELPPIEAPTRPSQSDTLSIIGFKGPKRKVLIVDDKNENRLLLVKFLAPLGFELEEAIDGQDALAKASLFQPDLILMDIIMPGMDGLEATRHIRQAPALSETIIIAVSASVSGQDQQQSREAGCDDFVAKPIQLKALLQKIQHHLKLEGNYKPQPVTPEAQPTQALPLIGPSPEQAALLLDLAMKGDIKGLKQQSVQLVQLDEKYGPFAQELQQLAQRYRIKQILQMLRSYVEGCAYES
jgi:signal transduction histidine kinase/DNA-binding NarL/FixJ family response regulator